ncbi:formate dehydrogenase accessory protein FdhE [Paracoccus aerodenitrificans]|uniref:formate dehydrogenase accessory protein FdhE n=1 Tax=Paracoccus aerodenitrificans TaxID=3017781 RepID=UPI0022F0A509|nr:formate dehydrogenase accessory protein FdhE [Paracoccus aerodenitrificans]WBU65415.1 formate dehydrogenase accessory protein FdhE [Paracoccus aerodenitrificans]
MSPSPDPSVIGGVASPEFARMPDPQVVFARRAQRFRHLAGGSQLAPYLLFLADICDVQVALAAELPTPAPVSAETIARNRSYRMPPIDRATLIASKDMAQVMDALLERAAGIDMPEPARAALQSLRDAPADDRQALLAELASDHVPDGFAAPAAFAAAAFQLAAARLAALLDADQLVPVRVGTCPSCGGRPVSSLVTATQHLEGARYACCAGCATQWNEVRVKCLCCGSTKGIGYRAVDDGSGDAVIKAEICNECQSWVKILYQNRDTGLEPVADDIASLGLDALMRETEWDRGGFNPFLIGY